jgi:16S rRNA processing protein RimM
MTKTAFVRIGRFIRPHGLKGEILVHCFTEDPFSIGAYGPVYALPPETPNLLSEADLPPPFLLRHVRHGSNQASVLVSIDNLTTRTHVEAFLKNPLDIFVPRARLKDNQLGEEEFFHADLIGLQAWNEHGTPIGHVVALHNFGAGDILEIERTAADQIPCTTKLPVSKRKRPGPETLMIPFRQAFVPEIDLQNHRLTVIYDDKDEPKSHAKEEPQI